jgi:hypothetical protein
VNGNPCIVLRFPLEGEPQVTVYTFGEGETERAIDWLRQPGRALRIEAVVERTIRHLEAELVSP